VENPAPEQPAVDTPQEPAAAQPAAAADIATGQVNAAAAEAVTAPENAAEEAPPAADTNGAGLDVILHIPVTVQVVLGRAKMPISRLMSLGPGAVVPLDRKAGEPVEVVVNGRLVARGEVVLLDDGVRFGISLTEIVEPGARTC
jgi:flagellar motor switch protein FliN/FliY